MYYVECIGVCTTYRVIDEGLLVVLLVDSQLSLDGRNTHTSTEATITEFKTRNPSPSTSTGTYNMTKTMGAWHPHTHVGVNRPYYGGTVPLSVPVSRLDRGLSRLLEFPLPTALPLYLQANRSLNTVLPAIN